MALKMYRLLVLLCLANLVAGKWGVSIKDRSSLDDDRGSLYWSGSTRNRDPSLSKDGCGPRDEQGWSGSSGGGRRRNTDRVEVKVSQLARQLISIGETMEQFCTTYSDRALREVYGVEHFKLIVRLSEFTEDSIEVRVRERLVSILARSCTSEYAALRILPDVVDARRACWRFEGGTLTVLFPYNVEQDTELQSRCGRQVDFGVIIVPKSEASKTFDRDYDLTFGDANLKSAIMQYQQSTVHEDTLSNDQQDIVTIDNQ